MAHRRLVALQSTFVALALVFTAQVLVMSNASDAIQASVLRIRTFHLTSRQLTNVVENRELPRSMHTSAPATDMHKNLIEKPAKRDFNN